MSKTHVMIDIETLDTRPTAVIASMAVVRFALAKGVLTERMWNVALQPQLDAGRTISAATLQWWFDREKAVQESTFLQAAMSPIGVLSELDEILKKDDLLWGNGATFDNVLIKHFAENFDRRLRHKYYNDRCFRTLAATFDPQKELRPDNLHKHDALADCQNQAQWFVNIVRANQLTELE